jgi:NAD(P)H-nitrite reductase large subunit
MNEMVCNCKMVYKQEIERFVKKNPGSTFQELVMATDASTGCGRCRAISEKEFEFLMKKYSKIKQLSFDFER